MSSILQSRHIRTMPIAVGLISNDRAWSLDTLRYTGLTLNVSSWLHIHCLYRSHRADRKLHFLSGSRHKVYIWNMMSTAYCKANTNLHSHLIILTATQVGLYVWPLMSCTNIGLLLTVDTSTIACGIHSDAGTYLSRARTSHIQGRTQDFRRGGAERGGGAEIRQRS